MTDYEHLAAQLRKPEGDFGKTVAENMNRSNAFLYDLVLDIMQVKEGDYLLEIGFGNGKTFPKVFQKADNILVSGLDYSDDMVAEAIENNKYLYDTGALDVQQGNSDAIPYEDDTFDCVFCINVVYFWDSPSNHLGEIYRVLKPGGRLYAGIRPKGTMQKMPFTKYGFTMYTTVELEELLRQSGFKSVESVVAQEPEFDLNGEIIQLESACVLGTK